MLTKDQELELIRAWKARRCERSMTKLIREFEPLFEGAMRRYLTRNPHLRDDFEQACRIGFYQAVEKYDESRDVRLSTFAFMQCKNWLNKVAFNSPVVKIPYRSRYQPLHNTGQPIEELNTLAEPRLSPEQAAINADLTAKRVAIVKAVLAEAKPAHRQVFLNFLKGETLRPQAARLGVSRERVRQIYTYIGRKIKERAAREGI